MELLIMVFILMCIVFPAVGVVGFVFFMLLSPFITLFLLLDCNKKYKEKHKRIK